jgi:hypothetical protein
MENILWLRSLVLISALAFLSLAGCASLPDGKRIQANMDQMVGYMGMMVYSTSRMADAAERMERKSNGLMADLQKKGNSAERAIQNYSQAFLDNDRAVIKNLQGIKQELGELKQTLVQLPFHTSDPEQAKLTATLQGRLNEIERKLSIISSKVEQNRQ